MLIRFIVLGKHQALLLLKQGQIAQQNVGNIALLTTVVCSAFCVIKNMQCTVVYFNFIYTGNEL
jgi:hypothetical protein